MPAAVSHVARYLVQGRVCHGRREGDDFLRLAGPPWETLEPEGSRDPAGTVRLLAPVTPSKIVCVGLNYRAHIAESVTSVPGGEAEPREPLLFFKPPSAVIGAGESIRYPAGVTRMDPEGELGVVIGRRAAA